MYIDVCVIVISRTVVIGYAIVAVENTEAYEWFFDIMNELEIETQDGDSVNFGDYLRDNKTVVISDRDKGLHNAVQSRYGDDDVSGSKGAIHLPCCFHLLQNVLSKVDRNFPPKLFWWLQKSRSAEDLEDRMERLRGEWGTAIEYLSNVKQAWVAYQHATLGAVTWGLRTSNLSEIVNSWILKERALPPYAFMSVTTRMLSLLARESSEEAARLANRGDIVTPYAVRMCSIIKEKAAGLHANIHSNQIATVDFTMPSTAPSSRACRVCVPSHDASGQVVPGTCTCLQPELTGLYCRHAYVAEK
jgi:hypothetical protein